LTAAPAVNAGAEPDAPGAARPDLEAAAGAFAGAACSAFDEAGSLVWLNPAGERLRRRAGEAAFGPAAARAELLRTGRSRRLRVEAGEGEARLWLIVRIRRIRDGSGAPLALCAADDVSAERRALQALQALRERSNDLVSLVSDMIWETDADWRLSHLALRDADADELRNLLGRSLFEIGAFESGRGAARPPNPRSRALFRERGFHMPRDGVERVFMLTGTPRFDPDSGAFEGFRGSGLDVTEKRRAERSAERSREALERALETLAERNRALDAALRASRAAEVAKDEFLARMSHELRTPLNAVLGLSSVLKHDMEDEPGSRRAICLDEIHNAGGRLLSLVEDVLSFSRGELRPDEIAREPVRLDALVRDAAAALSAAAEARGVALELEAPAEALRLDPGGARRLLINLIDNAVKFSHPGGVARVEARIEDGAARFVVRDDGVGVPADALPRIFEPFHQADGGASRAHGGAGLGLALCKRIVEAHGGRIFLESAEGRGAVATAILPGG
jgi:signal transduction histidine kinase